jgi:hypothetical protein
MTVFETSGTRVLASPPPGGGTLDLPRASITVLALCALSLALLSQASVARAQSLFHEETAGSAQSLSHSGVTIEWSTDDCTLSPAICKVRSLATSSMASARDAYGAGAESLTLKSNLSGSPTLVYWMTQGGEIKRANPSYRYGLSRLVATMESSDATGEVAADASHVYWIENFAGSGKVFRAPLAGGPRELVATTPGEVAHDLQVDGTGRVYFLADVFVFLACCDDVLHRAEPDGGGGFSVVQLTKILVDGYALDELHVFVASRAAAITDPLVISRGNQSDDLTDPASWSDLYDAGSVDSPQIEHMALSGAYLFWHELRAGAGSPLLRMWRSGASPTAITGSRSEMRDLLVAGDFLEKQVYWIEGGDIWRIPVAGSALSRDLDGDDITLEVTQAIQDASHTVPLVENKATFVRAYARLASSSDGASELGFFPALALAGSRAGSPLPGSPLRPIGSLPVSDAAVERASTANQFVFALPASWAQGSVDLTATVDPRDSILETDESNNTTSRSVTFLPVQGICMDIIPIWTTNGVEDGGTLGDRRRTFARAASLLPVDNLFWIRRGGTPKSKPVTGDPYNFAEADDRREMMYHWWHDFTFASTPSQCGSARTIRTAVVENSARFGLSSGHAAIIYYLQSNTNLTPENNPLGGVSGLAHEVGHQLGQGHIGCPGTTVPANPDGSYPYNVCSIEDINDHIGYDGLTDTLVVPFDGTGTSQYTDYMSYQPNYWASDWVYRKHFAELALPVPPAPAAPFAGGGAAAMAGGSEPFLLVAGFRRDDGSVFLGHGYELDLETEASVSAKLASSTDPSTELFVRISDINGVPVVDQALREMPMLEEIEGDTSYTPFFQVVHNGPDYLTIEILDLDDNLLASASYGLSPPAVFISKPSFGDLLGDDVSVEWAGNDGDGDPLEYRVFYSHDGGASYLDLVTTRNTDVAVDMRSLPTGSDVLFKVLVSDGLRSSEALAGPFSVANRPPEATILRGDYSQATSGEHYPFGRPGALRAYAYDSNDGPLTGTSLEWSLTGPSGGLVVGDSLALEDLSPGVYSVDLTATDSLGLTDSANQILIIDPKSIPDSEESQIDGRCSDPAYAADSERIALRYEGGEVAEVAAARVGGDVHVCFSGLLEGLSPDYVELRIDGDGSQDSLMQDTDRFIRLHRDGELESGVGDGSGGDKVENSLLEISGIATEGAGGTWQAELRIGQALVDSWAQEVGVGVVHVFDSAPEDAVVWPASLATTAPNTWGSAQLVPEPETWLLFACGALLLAGLRRRREVRAKLRGS